MGKPKKWRIKIFIEVDAEKNNVSFVENQLVKALVMTRQVETHPQRCGTSTSCYHTPYFYLHYEKDAATFNTSADALIWAKDIENQIIVGINDPKVHGHTDYGVEIKFK